MIEMDDNEIEDFSIKNITPENLVASANLLYNPLLQLVPNFQLFKTLDLKTTFRIECCKVDDMSESDKMTCFEILEQNMKKMYKLSNWGWNSRKKKKELFHPLSRFLICREISRTKNIQAFVHFRFETDFKDPVLYCYEIQLSSDIRKCGLGTFLMQAQLELAKKTSMTKLMLTVFKHNEIGLKFFQKFGFLVDPTDPSEYDVCDVDYLILSIFLD